MFRDFGKAFMLQGVLSEMRRLQTTLAARRVTFRQRHFDVRKKWAVAALYSPQKHQLN